MEIVIGLAAIIITVVAVLWWVNRKNPGQFRNDRNLGNPVDQHTQSRKPWIPR